MRNARVLLIIAVIMALFDLYVFQVVKGLTQNYTPKTRGVIFSAYWAISGIVILLMIILPFINVENWPKAFRSYVFAIVIGLFFAKLVASVFFLIDDIRRLIMWAI
ncbi:MAG: metallophosphoesterase, partial [Chitinophagaceae bacterium]